MDKSMDDRRLRLRRLLSSSFAGLTSCIDVLLVNPKLSAKQNRQVHGGLGLQGHGPEILSANCQPRSLGHRISNFITDASQDS